LSKILYHDEDNASSVAKTIKGLKKLGKNRQSMGVFSIVKSGKRSQWRKRR
jgi:hypothetical protein